ncbi:C2 domain-containing protein [Hordeum vulgare]|nr:C2 domain-containing protein [Hordeum vulgare]
MELSGGEGSSGARWGGQQPARRAARWERRRGALRGGGEARCAVGSGWGGGHGWDGAVFQALEAFKVQHEGKAFHLVHCWTIINGEDKFKAQYAVLLARWGGGEAVEDHGDDEKAQSWGKTNSKKEDKRDAASTALLEKVEGMISKKDLREEKHRQEKKEQMHTFMEIQRRRLDMDAERQAKMLEL